MPIYAYKCASCGHAKDVLQKISDDPLRVCPACGAEAFTKQLTAAGFQLKGSGWYVTDFRDGAKPDASKVAPVKSEPSTSDSKAADSGASSASTTAAPSPAKSDAAPAPAPAATGSTPAAAS
jgi:putative FmdB family regulatory protein